MLKKSDLDLDQRAAIAFIRTGEDSLLVADVGTGKTVIALTAGQDAVYSGEVHRWLVLAPLLVATDTWAKEPALWEHLQDIDVAIACGKPEQRLAAIQSTAQFVVMNYENLAWLLKQYPKTRGQDTLPFDGLICDEVDKLKDVSSGRFKQFRNRIKRFRKRIGLTGTLIPNDLTELWGQTYMVDGGQTFGRSFYKWRTEYFYPTDFNQYKWAPFPGAEEKLVEQLDGLAYRLPASGIPPVVPARPYELELPSSVAGLYAALERDFYLVVEDEKGSRREVMAANAAVLQGKLQQICAGFSYVDRSKDAVWHSKARFGWLENLRDRLSRQLLVFYHFTEELDELRRRYPGLNYLGSGVSNKLKLRAIDAWNAGDLDMLALHPASAGHGLNLQKSAAHDIAFLTIPWSGGMYHQVTGRLARRGQKAAQVDVHTALNKNTVDEVVFKAVTSKLSLMKGFQDALHEQQTRA